MRTMFLDDVRISVRPVRAATARRRCAARPTSRGAVPTVATAVAAAPSTSASTPAQTTLHDFRYKHHFRGHAGRPRRAPAAPRQGRRETSTCRPARHRRDRRRDRRADRRPRRGGPGGHGRQRRARRAGQHALRDRHPPGADARPEAASRARNGAPPRAPADRRRRASSGSRTRASPRCWPRSPRRRPRSRPTRSRRSSRTSGVMDLGHRRRAATDHRRRAGADRGRVVRRRPRARVPAPRRADADPAPHRGRRVARPALGPRGHPRRARGARSRRCSRSRSWWPSTSSTCRRRARRGRRSSARTRASGSPVLAISADSGEGLDALRAAVAELLPDAAGLAEPPEPAGRRRPPPRGGRRRVHGGAGGRRLPGVAGSGSSGWSPRPTSRTRSRPSGSSGSWSGPGSTARSGRPASGPGTPCGSAAHGAGVGARPRTIGDRARERARRSAGGRRARARSASSAGPSTRSITGTSRSPRTRARPSASSGSCSSRPRVRRTSPAVPSPPAAHRLAMVELAVDRQPGVLGWRDGGRRGAGTSYTVDTLEALRDGRRSADAVVHPVGRGAGGLRRVARAGPRILDLARLAVVPRGHGPDAARRRLGRAARSRVARTASGSCRGPCCPSPVAWCGDGPPPGARCATSSPTPSRATSRTTRCTRNPPEGH